MSTEDLDERAEEQRSSSLPQFWEPSSRQRFINQADRQAGRPAERADRWAGGRKATAQTEKVAAVFAFVGCGLRDGFKFHGSSRARQPAAGRDPRGLMPRSSSGGGGSVAYKRRAQSFLRQPRRRRRKRRRGEEAFQEEQSKLFRPAGLGNGEGRTAIASSARVNGRPSRWQHAGRAPPLLRVMALAYVQTWAEYHSING